MLRAFARVGGHLAAATARSTTTALPYYCVASTAVSKTTTRIGCSSGSTSSGSRTNIGLAPSTISSASTSTPIRHLGHRATSGGLIAPPPKRRVDCTLTKTAPRLELPEYMTVKDLAVAVGGTQIEIAMIGQRLFEWWPPHTRRQLRNTGFAVLKPVVLNFKEAKQIALVYHRWYVLNRRDDITPTEATEEERAIARALARQRMVKLDSEKEVQRQDALTSEEKEKEEADKKYLEKLNQIDPDYTYDSDTDYDDLTASFRRLQLRIQRRRDYKKGVNNKEITIMNVTDEQREYVKQRDAQSGTDWTQRLLVVQKRWHETDMVAGREVKMVNKVPVITIMGHVDHGKTTLLDVLRGGDVADREDARITQEVYSFQVGIDGIDDTEPELKKPTSQDVTFLDTPGHQSFADMRANGAFFSDLCLLVIAADEGCRAQTQESLQFAREYGAPIIVVINKMDTPKANAPRVLEQLKQWGLTPQPISQLLERTEPISDTHKNEKGGEAPAYYIELSAKTQANIPVLKQAILKATMLMKPQTNNHAVPHGAVLDSWKEEGGRGNVIRVILTRGQLQRGHHFIAGEYCGRVRDMRGLPEALPREQQRNLPRLPQSLRYGDAGIPIEIMGARGLPGSGAEFSVCSRDMALEHEHVTELAFDYPRQPRFEENATVPKIHPAMSGHLPEHRRLRMGQTMNAREIVEGEDDSIDDDSIQDFELVEDSSANQQQQRQQHIDDEYSDDNAAEQAFLQQSVIAARYVPDVEVSKPRSSSSAVAAKVTPIPPTTVTVASTSAITKKSKTKTSTAVTTTTPATTTTTTTQILNDKTIVAPTTPFPENLVAPDADKVRESGRKVRRVVIKANTSGSLQMLLDSIARHNQFVRSGTTPPPEPDADTAITPEKKKKTTRKSKKAKAEEEAAAAAAAAVAATTPPKQKLAAANEGRTRVEIDIIRANVGKVTPSDIQMAAAAAADLPPETDDDIADDIGFSPSQKGGRRPPSARGLVMSFRSPKPIGKVLSAAVPLRCTVRHYKVFHELLDDLYSNKVPKVAN